jgi:hypothetical protein
VGAARKVACGRPHGRLTPRCCSAGARFGSGWLASLARRIIVDAPQQNAFPFLHLPIDENLSQHLEKLDPSLPKVLWLKRMTKEQYVAIQLGARGLAQSQGVRAIWHEAAWTS